MATIVQPSPITDGFNARLWLDAFASIGGGYALVSGRRLAFLVERCDGEQLTPLMAQIIGRPNRQDAIKLAIERRQNGDVSAAAMLPVPAAPIAGMESGA